MNGEALPFYCPVFRSDSLKSPCKANLAKIAALQEKGTDCLGVLEKCQGCQGVQLEVTAMVTEQQVEPGFCDLHPDETYVIFLIDKPLVDGKFQVKCRSCAQGAPPQAQESPETMAEVPASPAAAAIGAQRTEILKALEKVIKRDGQAKSSTLAKKLGMSSAALTYHLKLLEKGGYIRIVPGEGPKGAATIEFASPQSAGADQPAEPAPGLEKEEVSVAPATNQSTEQESPPASKEIKPRICKECKINPEVIDSLQRRMGKCSGCLAAQAKENLAQGPKHSGPPITIPLNQPKFAEIKAWLEKEAEELCQELPQQIMYRLKLAHREANK